jgi:hypothetical protein
MKSIGARVVIVLAMGAGLTGCGKTGIVTVRRPLGEIRVCDNLTNAEWGCRHEFDVGSLVGMNLPDARDLARQHGYIIRRVAPVTTRDVLLNDFRKDRIDVETDAAREDSTVVRFVEKG